MWAAADLEHVGACPFCGSGSRQLGYEGVRDWSFHTAPGSWNYWECSECGSLFLDPRPTRESIGRAYGTYYTHGQSALGALASLKARLRNEFLSQQLGADLTPRIRSGPWRLLLRPWRRLVRVPFELRELARLSPGSLMDVGCGSGGLLRIAKALHWKVLGLEIDPAALAPARAAGLEVIEGSYEALAQFENAFDCIVCSHVLEHVHSPSDLLTTLAGALKEGGALILSLPNASSAMRRRFGAHWRGLEAPRHISIPSSVQLRRLLQEHGLPVVRTGAQRGHAATAAESMRIRRRGLTISRLDRLGAWVVRRTAGPLSAETSDFIEFVCEKRRDGDAQ